MNPKIACDILGHGQTRRTMWGMVHAISIFGAMNKPEESDKLNAAVYALKNWKAFEAECDARRNRRN